MRRAHALPHAFHDKRAGCAPEYAACMRVRSAMQPCSQWRSTWPSRGAAQAALAQRQQAAAEAQARLQAALAQAAGEAVDSRSGRRLTLGEAQAALGALELRAHALEAARLRMLRLRAQLSRMHAASPDKARIPRFAILTVLSSSCRTGQHMCNSEIGREDGGRVCADVERGWCWCRGGRRRACTRSTSSGCGWRMRRRRRKSRGAAGWPTRCSRRLMTP